MAHWHGLAKLRMHHDLTLEIMDKLTTTLGEKLRAFSEQTCAAFATKELCREFNARTHHQTVETAAAEGTAGPSDSGKDGNTRLCKAFNLNTYKLHSLGDYVATIREYGTTDSYSTEPVCGHSSFGFSSPMCIICRES
jgi:hypothetical protein